MRAVRVLWVDSVILDAGEWMRIDEALEEATLETMRQESVGYLVHEGETAIAIAQSRSTWDPADAKEKIAGVTLIPRAAVLELADL